MLGLECTWELSPVLQLLGKCVLSFNIMPGIVLSAEKKKSSRWCPWAGSVRSARPWCSPTEEETSISQNTNIGQRHSAALMKWGRQEFCIILSKYRQKQSHTAKYKLPNTHLSHLILVTAAFFHNYNFKSLHSFHLLTSSIEYPTIKFPPERIYIQIKFLLPWNLPNT